MSSRDEQRIEEEILGLQRPPRPRGLASDYLHQAADAFHAAGDPGHLYRQWPPKLPAARAGQVWMQRWVREERFRQARTCVLFAALAAEAYVNEFLAASDLSKTRLRKLDGLATVRKYTDATSEAFGEALFWHGDEVTPKLTRLFELRHQLVHPKPGFGSPGILAPSDAELDKKFAMSDLAEYVITVGGAAEILVRRAYGYDQIDVPGSSLWRGRQALFDYADRRATLPEPDEPDERTLWQLVGDRIDALPNLDIPELSINRLIAAKRAHRTPDQEVEDEYGADPLADAT